MRQRRKSVSKPLRVHAAYSIARRLKGMQLLRKGRRIAVYKAIDGEIDLTPFVRHAQRVGCAVYTPRILNMRSRKMEFVAWSRQARAVSAHLSRINPRHLDVVLVPLIAFDVHGWRLGFGAGFYDRKFAFMRRGFLRRPRLIGIAYDFQLTQPQTPRPWDVLLHAVVTEQRIYPCRTSKFAYLRP